MDFVVVGINHKSAGLDIREQYAVASEQLPVRLATLRARDEVAEVAILSTCNRVEYYVMCPPGVSARDTTPVIRKALGPAHPGIYAHAGREAMKHLLRVSASLDSLVLGEPQILGQVKEAYSTAFDAGTVGPGLKSAFERAFKAAKRVRSETAIARSAVSVGYVAVELAKTIFGSVDEVGVLLVGAGKMGILAAKNLSDSGAKRVQVANRTFERGQQVASRFGWAASAYSDLPLLLQDADVVICSTGSPRPVITATMVRAAAKKRRYRPLFLIDIAVPRDIEPGCGDVDDVYLYNIDDLEEVSRTNAKGRIDAAREAEVIVGSELLSFEKWSRERRAAPTIKALREKALGLANAEADKTSRMMGLDDEASSKIHKLAEVIAMRLIRGAMTTLKKSAGGPGSDDVAGIVQELFELERE